MAIFLGFLSWFSYFFIVFLYALKIARYLRMPVNLRWELYPLGFKEKLKFLGGIFDFFRVF